MEYFPLGVFSFDQKGRLMACNRMAKIMSPLKRKDLDHHPFSDQVLPFQEQSLSKMIDETIERGHALRWRELSMAGDDTSSFDLSVVPFYDDENEKLEGFLIAVSDLSAEAQIQHKYKALREEEHQQREQIEEINKELHSALEKLKNAQQDLLQSEKMAAMGEIISSLAHDINNPLAAIIGYTTLVSKNEKALSHKSKTMIDTVLSQAVRCEKIVKNFLMFARKSKNKKSVVEINALAKANVSFIQEEFPRLQIDFKLNLSEKEIYVMGNTDDLNQVF
jgi:C4-dicarboxylate-specific signal transduction histidine kinase